MTTSVKQVLQAAQQLSPVDQLIVIQALSQSLMRHYRTLAAAPALPPSVRRTAPVQDLATLAADFWPEDETADAVIAYLAQQRHADRSDPMDERW